MTKLMINLKNIFGRRNRILLAELVRTDFKMRYESSALGYVWSILNPLLLFAVLYLVFALFLGIGRGIEHFPVYLLTGIVLWRFFTEATNNGLRAITQRGSLIRKINFPKYIIVISGTVSSLINLAINLLVVFVFMLVNQVELSWQIVFIVPLVVQLYLFALGIAFFLSAVNVFLRDIGYLWEVFIQAAFYATPIIYPLSTVMERSELAGKLLILNPVAQVIQDARYFLITNDSATVWSVWSGSWVRLVPFAITACVCVVGGLYFKSKSGKFAEHV